MSEPWHQTSGYTANTLSNPYHRLMNTSGNAFPGVYPNGFSTQLTQRWRFGVTQTWPVTATIAVVAQLERDIVSSNLPLYSYNNTSILFGPQIRF